MNAAPLNAPVLIIGGGIGGLTLALELARRNIACQIFEQADEFSEIGAGLQLSPNAVRRLSALGLGPALETHICAPSHISIKEAINNRQLNEIPLGPMISERYGAPYWVVARQDLQALLLLALKEYDCVTLHTGKKFINYSQNPASPSAGGLIKAHMEDGSSYEGALLIGADGVWSRVRHMFAPAHYPHQTGLIAWRALIDASAAPDLFGPGSASSASQISTTQVWLGPSSHLVQYRVAGGDKVNLVAVTKGTALAKSWTTELPSEHLFEELRPWNKALRKALMEVKGWQAWPLVHLAPFKSWGRGRALLMGDAAHAVVPFLAQGAALAIEDAAHLAELIETKQDNPAEILAAFENERYSRCWRVLSKSMLQLQFYHAGSYLAALRNTALRAMPSSFLLKQYDWLYKY